MKKQHVLGIVVLLVLGGSAWFYATAVQPFSKAESLAENGMLGEAASVMKRYVTDHPSEPKGHLMLGLYAARGGDWGMAEERFKSCKRLDPRSARRIARIYLESAASALRSGSSFIARDRYYKAVAFDPEAQAEAAADILEGLPRSGMNIEEVVEFSDIAVGFDPAKGPAVQDGLMQLAARAPQRDVKLVAYRGAAMFSNARNTEIVGEMRRLARGEDTLDRSRFWHEEAAKYDGVPGLVRRIGCNQRITEPAEPKGAASYWIQVVCPEPWFAAVGLPDGSSLVSGNGSRQNVAKGMNLSGGLFKYVSGGDDGTFTLRVAPSEDDLSHPDRFKDMDKMDMF